jgi:hypothetical protein
MKQLFILLFVVTTTLSYAGINIGKTGKPVLQYSVESDTLDPSIPSGNVVVYGTVTLGSEPLENALVATCDSKVSVSTNSKGEYSITLTDIDSCLYMYKSQYNEIITDSYNFKSQHRVHLNFFASENIMIYQVEKPVIYVYGEKETACELKIIPKSTFTFTYPVYDNGWEFTTDENGNLRTAEATYPYLFWEGETANLNYKQEEHKLPNAFQIDTDSTIAFLENQLSAFGLNDREQTDFITFWAPRMMTKDYALVQFMWNDEYSTAIASMEITPKAESSLRLFMFFAGIDEYSSAIEVTYPHYPQFSRNGLTFVEWGGAELPMPKIQLP